MRLQRQFPNHSRPTRSNFSVSKQAKVEIEVEVHMDTEWNNLYQSKGEFYYDS